jgi:LAO/AO transport system kinase
MATNSSLQLLENMFSGNTGALARLMTLVERDENEAGSILEAIVSKLGRAFTIGITGPPGAGKSSLVDGLTILLRNAAKTVSVVAIDPSSPFSGGALLGDRIRMTHHSLDKGVFIRSMATRGSLGGLARATKDVIKLLDAFGMHYVLVETVGAGQTELDVMNATDTVIVVTTPESGDGMQVMKAGLMEIADILVVNKADREGAQRMLAELTLLRALRENSRPPEEGAQPRELALLFAQLSQDRLLSVSSNPPTGIVQATPS